MEDAKDVAMIWLKTGRTVDPRKWVEGWADQLIQAESDRQLKMILG